MNVKGGIINGNPYKEHEILQYFNKDGLVCFHSVKSHCSGLSTKKNNINISRPSTAFLKDSKNFTQDPFIMELLWHSNAFPK